VCCSTVALDEMNPFAEEEDDAASLPSTTGRIPPPRFSPTATTASTASKTPSSSAALTSASLSGGGTVVGGGDAPGAKRKQQPDPSPPPQLHQRASGNPFDSAGSNKNPFAPSAFPNSSNPFAPSAASSTTPSGSSNPFAPSSAAAQEEDEDWRSLGVDSSVIVPTSSHMPQQTLRLTTLEHRETSLKHLSIGDGLALVVTQQQTSGDSLVVTRRDVGSLHKTDGVIPLKDQVETIYLDPSSTYALLMLKAAKTMQKDAIFFISPQDASLKARGPLPALIGMTAACWYQDHGEHRALIGSANGVIQSARFSHSGLAELNMFCAISSSNPIAAIIVKGGGALVVAVDSTGFYQVFHQDRALAEGHLASQNGGTTRQNSKLEVVSAVGDEEGDVWVLTNRGLHRITVHSSTAVDVTQDLRGVEVTSKSELIYDQEHCFAMSHTRLFVLVLSHHVPNRQSNAISTKLTVISKINLRPVPNLEKPKATVHGVPPLGFARDEARGKVYMYSEKGVCLVEITDETKGAWKEFLARAKGSSSSSSELDFVRALEFCDRKRDRDLIRAAQADWHLARGHYVQAAELFAEVSTSVKSFEAIALALAGAPKQSAAALGSSDAGTGAAHQQQRQKKKALRIYLVRKLDKVAEDQKTLRTMLSTWICEAFLDELDQFQSSFSSSSSSSSNQPSQKDVDEEQDIVGAFCAFLGSHSRSLDPAKEVVFHLILSHGRIDILLVYAHLTKDYDRVVTHHIHRNAPREAVRALREFADEDMDAACALFYKHSPTLIMQCPEQLLEAWLALQPLEPAKLVPALSRFEEGDATVRSCVVRYLEHCVNDIAVRDEAIHNLLLVAYASDENELFRFVKRETSQPGGFCFDPGFALRLCSRISPRSRVSLLDALNMPEAACLAALEQNMPDVAQRIATEQSVNRGNDELSKRLWMLCCKNALKDVDAPTAKAVAILHASDGILSVEDLLVLLPDSVRMDELRDEVCLALERYNSEIQRLKGEMDESTESTQALRRDATEEKRRFDVIHGSKCCDICGGRIFVDPSEATPQQTLYTLASGVDDFYTFPCTHLFHSGCLFNRFIKRLRGDRSADQLARLAVSDREEDQAYLEEVLGANCPLCGDAMIQSVSHPLILAQDDADATAWE